MKKLKGLDFFERLFEDPQNELVEKAIEDGRIAVGYNCYVVPEVLLNAGKTFGLWMTAPNVQDTPQADYYLSAVMCSYSKALLESGIDGQYEFLGAMVFAPTCDHIRRGGQWFDLLDLNKQDNEKFFFHMIDAPYKVRDYTIENYAEDMRRLAAKFNEVYDANINDDTLRESIKTFNEVNSILRDIDEMRKLDEPKLTGTEWAKIYGSTKIAPIDMLIEPLKEIKAELEKRDPVDVKGKHRVMLYGSTVDKPEFVELIEAQGAIVVADRHCFGSLPGMTPMKEDGDPFLNVAEYYLDTCECPRMMENSEKRMAYLQDLIKEYKVDGALFELMIFCDLWNYEGVTFDMEMRKLGIPAATVSKEYNLTGEGQIRTRVQAFLESIKSKKEQEVLKNNA